VSLALAALLLAASARAEAPASAVGRVMSRVDALASREEGKDARDIAALDGRAGALFSELKPLGWRAAAPLGDAAKNPKLSAKARLFAVDFLVKLHDPAAFSPLSEILRDPAQSPDARLAAAQGLSALDAPPQAARRAFCAALGEPGLPVLVRDETLIALARLGCDDPATLAALAREFGARPRGPALTGARRALAALGRSRGEAAARDLLALVAWYPARGEARAAAIAALGEHRASLSSVLSREAAPVLRDALRQETDSPASMLTLVRLADGLGAQGEDLLLPLAAHPDAEVLAAAAEALARRKALKALPPLEAVLAGALNDPRFGPKPGRPAPAVLLERVEAAVESLRRARSAAR
jgi:hypothetical protein